MIKVHIKIFDGENKEQAKSVRLNNFQEQEKEKRYMNPNDEKLFWKKTPLKERQNKNSLGLSFTSGNT